jgi:L-ascorbate metabolism protein UlaG (beta-lactamase superfamily)
VTRGNLYLKQNVQVEPLINNWYAWSGLIFPATAAMYIANSHLKIMQSFVSGPQVHVAALKNPKMIGGPFINYEASRVGEVRKLLEKTIREQAPLLELAAAVKQLYDLLSNEAKGLSLEPLYQKVPGALKGYVELVYDLNDNAGVRFIEGLLYKSRYYNPASQSLSLSLTEKDDRCFVFSTPRLECNSHLKLNIPFSDERLDSLFETKDNPSPYNRIKELLEVKDQEDELLESLLTEEAPPVSNKYSGDGVRVRYLGHACLLIESKHISILSDPVVSYKIPGSVERYTYADLPERIDYVLITHSHQDHCMVETLLQLRHRIKNVIVPKNSSGALMDPSLKLVLQNIGFHNVREIDEMEAIAVENGQIVGLPFLGEHADLNVRSKTAYLVELAGRRILFAADSNNIEPRLYEHIQHSIGEIDLLFLGMECDGAPLTWIYGSLLVRPVPRTVDQSRRLNGSDYERGIEIVNRLKPKQVYVYAMGQEPWLTHVTSIQYTPESRPIVESNKLVAECRSRGLMAERLFGRKEIFLDHRFI